jgi:hypothetical protein
VIAYFRDSGGDEQERSVAQQQAEAQAYCERHHLALGRCFVDEATPGSSTVGRQAFDAPIRHCRSLAPSATRRDPEAPGGRCCWT